PVPGEAADVEEEVLVDPRAVLGVRDLGMKLHGVDLPLWILGRGEEAFPARAEERESGRQSLDEVAVARPDAALLGEPRQKRPGARDRQGRLAVLPAVARTNLPAQLLGEELHAVADAQDRRPTIEHRGRNSRRARLEHARGSAREDDALRVERLQLV